MYKREAGQAGFSFIHLIQTTFKAKKKEQSVREIFQQTDCSPGQNTSLKQIGEFFSLFPVALRRCPTYSLKHTLFTTLQACLQRAGRGQQQQIVMRKLLSVFLLSLLTVAAFSQNPDPRRKMEVTGTAEQEVTPDIIYVSISLKEYFKDNNTKNRVNLESLEQQLLTALANYGIPKENLMVENVSSYSSIPSKKKNPEFLESKQYRLKLSNVNYLNLILDQIDKKGVQHTGISSYDYSKIEALKRELKIKALQMAKDKASYLASALGDRVGKAIEVQEINNEYFPQPVYRASVMMAKSADANMEAVQDIDFKKIKLSYQMRVVFELL